MQLDLLPLYAAARLASGRWLVWAPGDDDPFALAVRVVAVLKEPGHVAPVPKWWRAVGLAVLR
jgi:hypothetical protein